MHGNRRYVKLAWIGFGVALALASPAQAESVTGAASEGVLAVAADGSPRVAYAVGRNLYIARRTADAWRSTHLGRLPGPRVVLAGIAVEGRGTVCVLAEDLSGGWITLVRGQRAIAIARTRGPSSYGPAGLALDASRRPAVAYAVHLPSGKTFLRLTTLVGDGRLRIHRITREGFPASSLPPAATPVLVGGRLHVVETYTSAAIEWRPIATGAWEGQYLFASRLGSPLGAVGAVQTGSTLWSSWTQDTPEAGQVSVLLTSSAETQETFTLTRGIFVAIADATTHAEVGAYDWVDAGDTRAYAGIVIAGTGDQAWQLDGRLEGYAIPSQGGRQLLLSRGQGLEWFEAPPPAPALPRVAVRLAVDADGKITGSVAGANGGAVELYRELPHSSRELVATALLAADGSFEAQVPPPTTDTLYRGVYPDPQTGIPFASLPGVLVGVSPAKRRAMRYGRSGFPQGCPQTARTAVEMLKKEISANCGHDFFRSLDPLP